MEQDWIRRAQQGDARAFETLMGAYEKKIYGLCLRMMGNSHDGEDAAQEAIIRIWQKMPQYREQSSFGTWAYRVAASCCMDAIRKRRTQPSLEEMGADGFEPRDESPTPHEEVEKGEREAAVQKAVSSVPEAMRAVFLLRDVHGRSVEETARILGISEGTVKSRLSRARLKIAAALRASGLFEKRRDEHEM